VVIHSHQVSVICDFLVVIHSDFLVVIHSHQVSAVVARPVAFT